MKITIVTIIKEMTIINNNNNNNNNNNDGLLYGNLVEVNPSVLIGSCLVTVLSREFSLSKVGKFKINKFGPSAT